MKKNGEIAVDTGSEAEKISDGVQLSQRNGDEVRHSYWNAIMVKELDGKRGEFLGFREPEVWASNRAVN